MGEPSSGGLTLLQILGLLERFDLASMGPQDPQSWHLIAQASRLAFADRNHYIADPDFVNTPGTALLDPAYLAARAALMNTKGTEAAIPHGKPPLWDGPLYARDQSMDNPGTSHISVLDAQGNALSMTTTIESAFGSHVMVGGFFLNNELTDFSFEPFGEIEEGRQALVANMVVPGKRPRSSMAPTIVFDADGKPVLILGSAGGSRIIGYVLQRIIAVLDWGMDLQAALDMPNILARTGALEVEAGAETSGLELDSNGNKVTIGDMNSGLTAIHMKKGRILGAADPRREGIGMGE